LVLSYGTPHDPWTPENVPPEYYAMFQDVEFPMSPTYRPENDDPYGDAWSDIPKDREKIQNWKRAYYAMTANLDWNVGRLQTALDDLVKWPGVAIAGSTCDACLNSVDVMPTLLGLAGAEIPADVEGMDLSHCVRGETGPEPEFAFLQNTGACAAWQNGHEWRALRDKQYTYAVYRVDGKELLFDNQADPYQARNLVDDPAFAEVLARCQNQLETRMCELNDTFPESLWYKDHWISEDRRILRTATLDTPPPPC
jgi:arylsulfatase A-like enzyme